MGPPGAGKGTQAQMLAEKIGYERFSTGDAFRTISRQDTPLGREVKDTIDNGRLAPPALAAKVVIEAIRSHVDKGTGLIFDGTPRTVEEAALVDAFFVKQGYGNPLVVYLRVDREDMETRNTKRRFCLGIKGDFPVVTPEDEQRCADLGGTVGMRPDDEAHKMATRWQEFITRTYPVVERYLQTGIAREVNGKQPIGQVHTAVMKVMETVRKL